MFKETLKIYFKNLKFIVFAMAFIYLGSLFFIISSLKGAFNAINHFTTNTITILQESGQELSIDFDELKNSIQLENITDFQETLKQAFDSIVNKINETSENTAVAVNKIAEESLVILMIYFAVGLVFLAIMFLVSSCVCGMKIKKENGVQGGFKRFLMRTLLKSIVVASIISLIAYFIQKISWIAGIGALLLLLFEALFTLYRAYIVQKGGKGLFKAIKVKDVFIYFGAISLLYVITFLLVFCVFLLLQDIALSILIVMPFLVYTNKFFDVYAEIYVVKNSTAQI